MTIEEFIKNETCGRRPLAESRNPFTCGLTGKTYSISQVQQRTDFLSRALGKRMGWSPNQDTPWEKVVGIFSANTVSEGQSFCLFPTRKLALTPPPPGIHVLD